LSVSLETQTRIQHLRLKAKTPQGLTLDEMKEAITFLRAERLAMPPTKSSTKKSTPAPDADDLLSELGI